MATSKTSRAAATAQLAASLVDLKLTKQWNEQFARFQAARGSEAAGWDDTYEALDSILCSKPPLYLAGGYKTETAFLQAHLPGVSRSTIHTSIRVARHFEPDDEKRFGTAKLALLIDYPLIGACRNRTYPAVARPARMPPRIRRSSR